MNLDDPVTELVRRVQAIVGTKEKEWAAKNEKVCFFFPSYLHLYDKFNILAREGCRLHLELICKSRLKPLCRAVVDVDTQP